MPQNEQRENIMSMRSSTSPRRVYSRKGTLLVCFQGVYFSPGKEASSISADKEVKIEILDTAGGKKRIQVTQRAGKTSVKETWKQTNVKFESRASA